MVQKRRKNVMKQHRQMLVRTGHAEAERHMFLFRGMDHPASEPIRIGAILFIMMDFSCSSPEKIPVD